ncbi:phage terminase large subunit [Rhodocista pekingensis]|uniref:Phage terminase large subunit n=1 Tax=Rhodocista pekingensis TaxID=201185 RepID=A0ABW2KR73_9PROT
MPPVRFTEFLALWNHLQGRGTPDLHLEMADWLEDALARGRRELLLLAFRDSGKSSIVGLYCAWRLARDPDCRILVLAADLTLAKKMVRTVKRVVERHPLCAGLKPEKRELWGAEAFTLHRPLVGRDPSMAAQGVGGNFTGSHADLVVCDDVEVPNTCDTAPKREELRTRLREIASVLAPGGTSLYIGTPHTWYSIYAREPRPELGEREPFLAGYARLELPVYREGPDGARLHLWPERFGPEVVERIRRRAGPAKFLSQMLLTPRPAAAGRLDPDRLRPYAAEPDIRTVQGRPVLTLEGRRLLTARAWWDPALGRPAAGGESGAGGGEEGGGRGDGSVVAVVFGDADGRAYLHRVLYVRAAEGTEPAQDQCRQVADLVEALQLATLHLETNGIGGFLPGLLRQTLARRRLACAVLEETSRRPKALRILEAFDARLAAGMLAAHRSVWETPFVREMRDWRPDGRGGHDDGLDAAAGALLASPARLPRLPPPPRAPGWGGGTEPFLADTDFDP